MVTIPQLNVMLFGLIFALKVPTPLAPPGLFLVTLMPYCKRVIAQEGIPIGIVTWMTFHVVSVMQGFFKSHTQD
jgi:hypothetical protein